jgi:hypothetical protein
MLRLSDCEGPQVLFARMTVDGPFPSALCVITKSCVPLSEVGFAGFPVNVPSYRSFDSSGVTIPGNSQIDFTPHLTSLIIRVLLSVGVDANDQNLLQRGALL